MPNEPSHLMRWVKEQTPEDPDKITIESVDVKFDDGRPGYPWWDAETFEETRPAEIRVSVYYTIDDEPRPDVPNRVRLDTDEALAVIFAGMLGTEVLVKTIEDIKRLR